MVISIPEGELVTAGMFSVNQHLAVVLFDFGSSHSFMSQAFVQKHSQPVTDLGYGYCISSAGADVLTNRVVRGATLDLSDRVFSGKSSGHAWVSSGCYHGHELDEGMGCRHR